MGGKTRRWGFAFTAFVLTFLNRVFSVFLIEEAGSPVESNLKFFFYS